MVFTVLIEYLLYSMYGYGLISLSLSLLFICMFMYVSNNLFQHVKGTAIKLL